MTAIPSCSGRCRNDSQPPDLHPAHPAGRRPVRRQDVLSAVVQSDMDKLRLMVSEADRGNLTAWWTRSWAPGNHLFLGVRSSSFVAAI